MKLMPHPNSLKNLLEGRGRGKRWRGKLPIPPHAHPLVRKFIAIANREQTTIGEIAERTKFSPASISGWRYHSNPSIDRLDAVLNVMGYELYIRPMRGCAQPVDDGEKPHDLSEESQTVVFA